MNRGKEMVQVGDTSSWFSTVLKVAEIAGQILTAIPFVGAVTSNEPKSYSIGGIEAGWDTDNNTPYFKNIENRLVAVNFASPGESDQSYSSAIIPLSKKNQSFNPQKYLNYHKKGTVSIFDATPQLSPLGGPSQVLLQFGTVLVLGAVATYVVPGFKLGIRKIPNSHSELYYEKEDASTQVREFDCKLNVLGQSLHVTIKSAPKSSATAGSEVKFPLPADLNLSVGLEAIGTLRVDEENYREMVANNTDRVRMMS